MTNDVKGVDTTKVIEVSTNQLSEHSKQVRYTPPMGKKKWSEFVANIAKAGLHHPIIATKGFKVVGNIYHFRAAKELGIKDVKVIFEDVTDDGVPSYMTNNTLQVPELKSGQRAALVVRLFYEEMAQEAKANSLANLKQNADVPNLERRDMDGRTNEILAKKAGIGKSSMAYLLAVYKSRSDLFEQVFNGEYSINKAYTEMKADEAPEDIKEEIKPIEVERKALEVMKESESSLPQIDESQPSHSLDNRLIQMRKKALSLTIEVLDESEKMHEAKPEVKESARSQLLTLTRSCVLALGHTADSDEDAELLAVVHELLNKLNGGN